MFRDWDSFYLLVGSAAGALIGIMFVVITLSAGYETKSKSIGTAVFNTPIVFHFSMVLIVSVLSAVPGLPPSVTGGLIAAAAAVGLAYALTTTIRMLRAEWQPLPDVSDKLFYGVFPSLIYLGLGASALQWTAPYALYAIAACTVALLLNGIRNAWDLATYFLLNPRGPRNSKR